MDFVEFWSIYRPKWTVETYIVIAVISAIVFFILLQKKSKKQWIAGYILLVYLIFVFASTVFTRHVTTGKHYESEIFWSYTRGIDTYGIEMVHEIVLNILMLMPIGVLFPIVIKRSRHKMILTVVFGILITVSIELLQLIMQRGLCEFDDMIHNTLGVILGYGLYHIVILIRKVTIHS